jgi:carboxylesterase
VTIAALCGERVVVAGISIGAALAGWIASRTAIDTAVAISAFCGLRVLPGGTNDGFGSLLRRLPNAFCWWDPLTKQAQPPPHGYPRFATHALGQSLAVSTAIPRGASAFAARRAIVVCNRNEPVVNNAFALRRFTALEARGTVVEHVELEGLPDIHDIIEPEIPQARIDLVYPRLIELIMTA